MVFLSFVIVSLPAYAASGVSISDINVTPSLASAGTTVTASVTVQNQDTNSVSLTVTVSDGGVNLANKALTVPAGGSATVHLQFKTVTEAPHCYAATTAPVAASKGYCESGGNTGVLGGASLAIDKLGLLAPLAGLAALGVFSLVFLDRRRRKNQ